MDWDKEYFDFWGEALEHIEETKNKEQLRENYIEKIKGTLQDKKQHLENKLGEYEITYSMLDDIDYILWNKDKLPVDAQEDALIGATLTELLCRNEGKIDDIIKERVKNPVPTWGDLVGKYCK